MTAQGTGMFSFVTMTETRQTCLGQAHGPMCSGRILMRAWPHPWARELYPMILPVTNYFDPDYLGRYSHSLKESSLWTLFISPSTFRQSETSTGVIDDETEVLAMTSSHDRHWLSLIPRIRPLCPINLDEASRDP